MCHVRLLTLVLVLVPAAFACEFQYDPASIPQCYRATGWILPGADFEPTRLHTPTVPHNQSGYLALRLKLAT
jgi:hypothetical protein